LAARSVEQREPDSGKWVATVGLTGAMGAGKSTALAVFRELGALTESADEIVHHLYDRPSVRGRLVERFGADIVAAHGRVDRRALARKVAGSRTELRWLEDLTHPLVAAEVQARAAAAPSGSVVVTEVPLLFEARYKPLFDVVVTIEAPRDVRARRAARRADPRCFEDLDILQATPEQRKSISDFVFVNDGEIAHLRAFVHDVYEHARDEVAAADTAGEPGRSKPAGDAGAGHAHRGPVAAPDSRATTPGGSTP
jgi:dephospho-CoA kinase